MSSGGHTDNFSVYKSTGGTEAICPGAERCKRSPKRGIRKARFIGRASRKPLGDRGGKGEGTARLISTEGVFEGEYRLPTKPPSKCDHQGLGSLDSSGQISWLEKREHRERLLFLPELSMLSLRWQIATTLRRYPAIIS